MEAESATADASAAESTDAHGVNSTLASTPVKSERNTNESTREFSGHEESPSSTDPYQAPAGSESRDADNALDEGDVGMSHLLEEGNTAQLPSNASRDDTTRQSGEAGTSSSDFIEEIRRLREKVSQIEQQAKPRPNYSMLEAQWRTAREKSDPEKEKKLWEWFIEQRKTLAGSPVSVRPYRDLTYKFDLSRLAQEMEEDPVYEDDVLRWRRSWERKLVPLNHMLSGRARMSNMMDVEMYRNNHADQQRIGNRGFEDSDSDESLDFEYNLNILRQKYLKKVDRLYEERDVRLQEKLIRKEERAAEIELLQYERDRAKEELQAVRNADEEPKDQARKEAAARTEDASAAFSGSAHDTMDETAMKSPPRSNAFPKLNRVDWIGFKALQGVCEEDSFAIDVLIGEPVISLGFSHRPKRSTKAKWAGDKEQMSQDATTTTKQPAALTGQSPLPERIRIHSKQLLCILEKIHGESVDSTRSLVIIRPFRVLIYYNQALRDWCQKLEKKFSVSDTSKSSSTGIYGPALFSLSKLID